MHISLRQLEIFKCVAKYLSFTHAAGVLHLSQPAVSTQIKNLEEQIDLKLFEMVGKQLVMTDAARTLLEKVDAIQSEVDNFGYLVNSLKNIEAGQLTISIPAAAQIQLMRLISAFNKKYPLIELEIILEDRIAQLKLLQDNKSDICIMGTPPAKTALESIVLFSYKTWVIAPINYLNYSNKKKIIPVSALDGETFIVTDIYSNSRTIFEKMFSKVNTRLININNGYSVKYAVYNNMGLAVVSDITLESEFEGVYYQKLNIKGFPISSDVCLVHRNKKLLSPASKTFRDFAIGFYNKN
ncbi:LysR family transcriptional regulator [Piscirickettsia litoralis]|uniref:HTH lysR-type domain-containing protein n=1 Tax=Piscirickettsia litoralis TaxID=1891921 RepID=A0ABX2ZYW5_9GAMM|nr:LysR family transcriptional regulator [Piscirickettsia litoralis]ODN41762.1 hypothetical protein BGC07_00650 [Piscirickettsia litoralis]